MSKSNNDAPVALSPASISNSLYDRFENGNENNENQLNERPWVLTPPISSHDQQTASVVNKGALSCQVYMNEEDLNRFIQSRNIFINQGRFHYKHKPSA